MWFVVLCCVGLGLLWCIGCIVCVCIVLLLYCLFLYCDFGGLSVLSCACLYRALCMVFVSLECGCCACCVFVVFCSVWFVS